DLYYRLAVVPLHVPALRERTADIRLLVQHFLAKHGPRVGKVMAVDPEVYDCLESYAWPGNVRELENLVQRALILAHGSELTVEDFAFHLDDCAPARPDSASLRDDLKDEERRRILNALDQCHGNQSEAAKLVGMPRRTLVERLRVYGVARKQRR
ncbi:MAG TPA: helix-turn-helix domain-containing protein, partial [Kofleriaceae bacterium]|nr:helix-turn-helix domain-containing protein [Kofleriaceae bacterium]